MFKRYRAGCAFDPYIDFWNKSAKRYERSWRGVNYGGHVVEISCYWTANDLRTYGHNYVNQLWASSQLELKAALSSYKTNEELKGLRH